MAGALQLCVSMPLVDELVRVMGYPKLGFSAEDQRAMVEDVLRIAALAEARPAVDAVREDPSDNAVLACAIASRADLIVSGDAHLLALHVFHGIPIVRAATLACWSGRRPRLREPKGARPFF